MNKVIARFERLMFSSFFVSVLDIIIGILFTDTSTKICIVVLGSLILVHGIFYIIRYIYDGLGTKFFAVDLIVGVAAIILGLFTVFFPLDALKFMGVLFCVWLIISGIEKLFYAFRFMRANEDIYPLVSFIGILTVVMGVLAAFNPFKAFMLITRLVGLFLICSGLFDIMTSMLFWKRAKVILKIIK